MPIKSVRFWDRDNMRDAGASSAMSRTVRLLCLHGRCQCASVFCHRLEYLTRRLNRFASMRFVDAPHILADDDEGKRAWVCNATNDREEVYRAIAYLEEHLAQTNAPSFDGVLGFSEGASLAVAILYVVQHNPSKFPLLATRLRFAVVAGGASKYLERVKHENDDGKMLSLPSLHFGGEADEAVPIATSRELAVKVGGEFVAHKQSHVFPVKRAEVDRIVDFIVNQGDQNHKAMDAVAKRGLQNTAADDVELLEEFDALTAIFAEDVEVHAGDNVFPPVVRVRLKSDDSSAFLRAEIPCEYPTAPPRLDVEGPSAGPAFCNRILGVLNNELRDLAGIPCLFQLTSVAREAALEEGADDDMASPASAPAPSIDEVHDPSSIDDDNEIGDDRDDGDDLFAHPALLSETLTDQEEDAMAREALERAAAAFSTNPPSEFYARGSSGGRCDFTVGLVGKPSAGKSTFFNAATEPTSEAEEAKVAAYPFTTIDPNIGVGQCALRTSLDISSRSSSIPNEGASAGVPRLAVPSKRFHGRPMPVIIKDVAGLVPGACKGKGKGNQFLNDLCDAHALIVVIDASGTATNDGVSVGSDESASNPSEDIKWLLVEVHMWIYGNLLAKWATICRRLRHRPHDDKFLLCFTGYGCSGDLVKAALLRAGMPRWPKAAEELPSWTARDLHAVVAQVVHLRFPIVAACNKCDIASASTHLAALREDPSLHYPTIPCCALEEWTAVKSKSGGVNAAHRQFGVEAFGVRAALSTAVSLREPTIIFVVSDHDTQHAAGAPTPASRCPPQAPDGSPWLGSAVMLIPGTTTEDAFKACCRPPYNFLDGELVRAEESTSDGKRRVMARDEILRNGSVIRFASTKKSRWQQQQQHRQTMAE